MGGKMEGKAGRIGRPRSPFMKQIIEDVGRTAYEELKIAVTEGSHRADLRIVKKNI